MTERLCSEGHVIDTGRETCSRCNGAPVETEVILDPADAQAAAVQEAANEGVILDPAPESTDEVAPVEETTPAVEETPAPEAVSTPDTVQSDQVQA